MSAAPAARPRAEPIRARTQGELGAKRPIEVRHISEATVERDIDNLVVAGYEPQRRFAQARAQHVLVRGDAGDTVEGSQEVVGAQTCLPRHLVERETGVWSLVERAHYSSDSRLRVDWRPVSVCHTSREGDRAPRELHGDLVPGCVRGIHDVRRSRGYEWGQGAHRRDPRNTESVPADKARIGSKTIEVIRGVPERHATVAFGVLVSALETLLRTAEHQRARGHQRMTGS